MTDPDDNAFPGQTIEVGLTKREEFARSEMQGLLANPYMAQMSERIGETAERAQKGVARTSVEMADALIVALNERSREGG